MNSEFTTVQAGSISSVRGFLAGAGCAGIKTQGRLDLGLLFSEVPSTAVGLFTTNKIRSAPVLYSLKTLGKGLAQAVVVNSGCANACTGEEGLTEVREMAGLAASRLNIPVSSVLVASTGVIGVRLPMDRIRQAMPFINVTRDGGHDLARAMMTTDTVPKEMALIAVDGETRFTVAGVAKGSGMIHPNMATMLCFLATDAKVERHFLEKLLRNAVNSSFNMVTIDGDTSPSDTVFILANGLASDRPIDEGNGLVFQEALNRVCVSLAKQIAGDGEGATKLIEVSVENAATCEEARQAARTVAGSSLVKAAIHGNDPNWGRVAAALGRSGVSLDDSRLDIYMDGTAVMKSGRPVPFDKQKLAADLDNPVARIGVSLNAGKYKAVAWGCDLSEEYVTINSTYTT